MSKIFLEMPEKDYELVIVDLATVSVYDFFNREETIHEATDRWQAQVTKDIEKAEGCVEKFDSDFWKNQLKEAVKKKEAGCKCMKYEEFRVFQREHLLNGELREVTADEYNEMLNVLPPLYWTEHTGVEMFCMVTMVADTCTVQYAHDKLSNKYYSKIVDCKDRATWICEILKAK